MNKLQLLNYLHQCLAEGRRQLSGDGMAELANGLASRILATRGLRASFTASDRLALDRQWGQPGLADDVESAIERRRAAPPDVRDFVAKSLEAARSTGREPTGEDAEQAARVRLLVEASLSFEAARDLSISDMALDKYVADIAAGVGLPEATEGGEPLAVWLARTIQYLSDYNPYAREGREEATESDTVLDHQPTLLADWVRQGKPPVGSTEFDHEYMSRQIEVLEGILETLPSRIDALQSKVAGPTPGADRSIPLPKVVSARASAAIRASGDKFADRQQQDGAWDPGTADQARSTYALLGKFLAEEHGVQTFAEFHQRHLALFDEFLRELYKRYGQSSRLRAASIAELRDASRQKPAEQRGLDIGTRSRHMGAIAALLEHVGNSEEIDPKLKPSAFMGKKRGRARNERAIPTTDKMAELFHAPVFTGCRSFKELDEAGPQVFHRAAYFGPMFAHYLGMRREEFCGLAVDDIITDNGDLPYVHVCFNAIRRLKNVQSERNLALHPELIRLGFLDYVKRISDLGFERVFPDLHNPAINAPLGNRFYKELDPVRKRLKISPHQFRHFFNNELKQKRVSDEFRADMMGHGGRSETTERYCNPVEITLQREDLANIALRTAHLQPQPIRIIPWVEAKLPPIWARTKLN